MKTSILTLISAGIIGSTQAALLVDFNSTNQDGGPHNQAGYEPFNKGHEVEADLGAAGARTESYSPTFNIAGAANVDVTVDWPNTTGLGVRQSIDRTSQSTDPVTGFDANWNNVNGDLNLATDFIGIDTRTGNGGNGNWDGTTGTPTYMTLTLSSLPAGSYNWTSFHADTEHVHGLFSVELDTGTGFISLADGSMTSTGTGGTPNSSSDGSGLAADTFGALNTYNATIIADGVNDVTLRFAPHSGAISNEVHNQIWGINGFELTQVPEPSTALLGLLGLGFLARRRR